MSPDQRDLLIAIVGAAPAVLAPLISWVFTRMGVNSKSMELELLERQVGLIQKLGALEDDLLGQQKERLRTEVAEIVHDLVVDRERERKSGGTDTRGFRWVKRFLLLYEQPNLRASIYRLMFWALSIFGLFVSVSVLAGNRELGPDWLAVFSFGAILYIGSALLFRAAARRQQNRARERAEKHRERTGSQV